MSDDAKLIYTQGPDGKILATCPECETLCAKVKELNRECLQHMEEKEALEDKYGLGAHTVSKSVREERDEPKTKGVCPGCKAAWSTTRASDKVRIKAEEERDEAESHLDEAGEHLGIPAGASKMGGCRAIAHQAKSVIENLVKAQNERDALAAKLATSEKRCAEREAVIVGLREWIEDTFKPAESPIRIEATDAQIVAGRILRRMRRLTESTTPSAASKAADSGEEGELLEAT